MNPQSDLCEIARQVRNGETSASAMVEAALDKCDAEQPRINACTAILRGRARQEAAEIDECAAAGRDPGPLAGVPYAVKDLFDIAGIPTLAGSKINRENAPATADATLVRRLKDAGACLIAATNMDEYAYGFATENAHYGATRNPHDPARIAGGSSGGSAAIVAAGVVPFSLGSDTNGSIRVPASLCGIYGLKPTYGRLSRGGSAPFVESLDHVGPFARSVKDLALLLDILGGPDERDGACWKEAPEPVLPMLEMPWPGVRSATLGGYFERWSSESAVVAVQKVAEALRAGGPLEIPLAEEARTAAYLLTVAEGAQLHAENLKKRPLDFDSLTRDRFLAGLFLPASVYVQAQRFRRVFQEQMRQIFAQTDILICPATPISAPLVGQKMADFNGHELIARQNLGLYTQPFSFIGLPSISVPVTPTSGGLPLGVQLIAAPRREGLLLQTAHFLEKEGLLS